MRTLADLLVEVGQVDAAVCGDVDGYDLHAGHLGGGGVGAVGGERDEAHVALVLALRGQVGHDGAQAGVLALRAAGSQKEKFKEMLM